MLALEEKADEICPAAKNNIMQNDLTFEAEL